ncbi:putative gustatory receptor 28b [Malaya genurostris]|uniref:putative gustatory receptor 28b n=1 Tax=Malaya genurostris TaxID=325434 RepID=UPI0026F3FB20|nr:putative gustatory receptor 28b [Malaya genurostris]
MLYNKYIRLWQLLSHDVPENFDEKISHRFLLKLVLLDGGSIVSALTLRFREFWLTGDSFMLYDVLFNVFLLAMSASVTNLFVAVSYLGAHYFRLLNYRIGMVNRMLKELDKKGYYWRCKPTKKVWMYNRLIRELHKLARLHGEVNQTVQRFMELHDVSLLVLVTKNFVAIIAALFGTFTMVVVPLRNNSVPTIGTYGYLLFKSIFHFFQFYYLVESATLFTKRGEKTGTLLGDLSKQDSNEQVDTSIDSFSLELLHRDHKINNAGLYHIDFSLIYAAMATIISYLIIAVQFQMTND